MKLFLKYCILFSSSCYLYFNLYDSDCKMTTVYPCMYWEIQEITFYYLYLNLKERAVLLTIVLRICWNHRCIFGMPEKILVNIYKVGFLLKNRYFILELGLKSLGKSLLVIFKNSIIYIHYKRGLLVMCKISQS